MSFFFVSVHVRGSFGGWGWKGGEGNTKQNERTGKAIEIRKTGQKQHTKVQQSDFFFF